MILGTGSAGGLILYTAFARDIYIFSVYIWVVLSLFQAADAHSGYGRFIGSQSIEPGTNDKWINFPWSL